MAIHENTGTPACPEQDAVAGPVSRRSVLRGAGVAGAAGVAVTLAGMPALAAAKPAGRQAPATGTAGTAASEHADGDAVVVHVRNVRTGAMDVYRGTSHVQVTDPALAARLARASR